MGQRDEEGLHLFLTGPHRDSQFGSGGAALLGRLAASGCRPGRRGWTGPRWTEPLGIAYCSWIACPAAGSTPYGSRSGVTCHDACEACKACKAWSRLGSAVVLGRWGAQRGSLMRPITPSSWSKSKLERSLFRRSTADATTAISEGATQLNATLCRSCADKDAGGRF